MAEQTGIELNLTQIIGDEEVVRWLAGKADKTKKLYVGALQKYCDFRGLVPSGIIDELEDDRKLPVRGQGDPELQLHKFIEDMREHGLSPKTISVYVAAIISYTKSCGYPLKISAPKAPTLKKNKKKALRPPDVEKLVNYTACLRDKAIILVMFQGGLDVSTVCSLDVGDVAEGINKGECPLALSLVREKEHINYNTFIGKDAIEAIKAYLTKREATLGPSALSDPLFIHERKMRDKLRINTELIQKVMRKLAVVSGLVTAEEMERADLNPCRPHALRSAFSSILKLEGVNNDIIEYWLGHAVTYQSAYFQGITDELREIYAEHEHSLSIHTAVGEIKKLDEKYQGIITNQQLELASQREELQHIKDDLAAEVGAQFMQLMRDPVVADNVLKTLHEALKKKNG